MEQILPQIGGDRKGFQAPEKGFGVDRRQA